MVSQQELKKHWLGGADDRLCAREQAKAWAVREVWLHEGKGEYGMYGFIAGKVKKTKDGQRRQQRGAGLVSRLLALCARGRQRSKRKMRSGPHI